VEVLVIFNLFFAYGLHSLKSYSKSRPERFPQERSLPSREKLRLFPENVFIDIVFDAQLP